MDRDAPHIVDIFGSARLVQGYLEGVTRDAFMRNVAGRPRSQGRDSSLEGASGDMEPMIGMRNRMIHTYDAVMDIVWRGARRIPELLALIDRWCRQRQNCPATIPPHRTQQNPPGLRATRLKFAVVSFHAFEPRNVVFAFENIPELRLP